MTTKPSTPTTTRREQLTDKAKELADTIADKAKAIVETVADKAKDLRSKAHQKAKDAGRAVRDGGLHTKDKIEDLKDKLD